MGRIPLKADVEAEPCSSLIFSDEGCCRLNEILSIEKIASETQHGKDYPILQAIIAVAKDGTRTRKIMIPLSHRAMHDLLNIAKQEIKDGGR